MAKEFQWVKTEIDVSERNDGNLINCSSLVNLFKKYGEPSIYIKCY